MAKKHTMKVNTAPLQPEETATSVVVGGAPKTGERAMRIARKWKHIPASVSDAEAVRRGMISPAILALIMGIIQELMTNCLGNDPAKAFGRMRGYVDQPNRMQKMGETLRLERKIRSHMKDAGYDSAVGDVANLRDCILDCAEFTTEDEFVEVHQESAFLAI